LDADSLALNGLDIVKSAENLVLDLELGGHGEGCSLLDPESLLFKGLETARRSEINDNGVAAGGFHRESLDDADAEVVGVRKVLAAAEAEGSLVALERLIVLICRSTLVSWVPASNA